MEPSHASTSILVPRIRNVHICVNLGGTVRCTSGTSTQER